MKISRWMTGLLAAAISLVALRAFAPPQPEPTSRVLTPYITTLNGSVLGPIVGVDLLPDGSGGGIKLASVQHGVSQPFDAASGLATGARRHGPLVVVKQLDQFTPLLYSALANGENLIQVVIRYYGSVGTNAPAAFFTCTLTDARIVSVRNWQPNANDPASAPYVHPEEVSFVYEDISWNHDLAGNSFNDSWGAPLPE